MKELVLSVICAASIAYPLGTLYSAPRPQDVTTGQSDSKKEPEKKGDKTGGRMTTAKKGDQSGERAASMSTQKKMKAKKRGKKDDLGGRMSTTRGKCE